jgi:hypothetical protein
MKRLFTALMLAILLLNGATPALAQGSDGRPGEVVFGDSRRLVSGDVVNGDLAIFGGNLQMEEGSLVEGDVVIFGGNATIDGEIEGDLAVIGGNARVGASATVNGDVASVGGNVEVDEAADVRGQVVETTRFDFGRLPRAFMRAIPPVPDFGRDWRFQPINQFFRIMVDMGGALAIALVIAIVGLLAVLFLPSHTETAGQAVVQAAPASFGVGLLTLLTGAVVIAFFFVVCCLAPLGLLAALALVLAALFGWIVVGYLLGRRMLLSLQKDTPEPTPAIAALVGVFVLTLVQQGLMALDGIPCLGFMFWLLGAGLWLVVVSTGLGAVVLTRFGTQPYLGTAVVRTPTPPPPPPPLPPAPPISPPPPLGPIASPLDVEPEVGLEEPPVGAEPGQEPPAPADEERG